MVHRKYNLLVHYVMIVALDQHGLLRRSDRISRVSKEGCAFVGVGMSLCTTACYLMVAQYFKKRRAFATAVGSSGASLAMLFIPMFIRFLLSFYGFTVSKICSLIDYVKL